MRVNNQHIALDELLALQSNQLDSKKALQCAEHLKICEECQNTLEAIKKYNAIELRQPDVEFARQVLDKQLLNITKQHVKKSRKAEYIKKIKCSFYENSGWKYLLLAAASLLLIVVSQPLFNLSVKLYPATSKIERAERELAMKFRSEFQKIAKSQDGKLKTDIYYNSLLKMVDDEDISVSIIREGKDTTMKKFYDYYESLNIEGGQEIVKVKVIDTSSDGKANELIVTETKEFYGDNKGLHIKRSQEIVKLLDSKANKPIVTEDELANTLEKTTEYRRDNLINFNANMFIDNIKTLFNYNVEN